MSCQPLFVLPRVQSLLTRYHRLRLIMSLVPGNVTMTAAVMRDGHHILEHTYGNTSTSSSGASSGGLSSSRSSKSSGETRINMNAMPEKKKVTFVVDHTLRRKRDPEFSPNPLRFLPEIRDDMTTIRIIFIPLITILMCIIFCLSLSLFISLSKENEVKGCAHVISRNT